ncbi:tail fiber protein [Pelagibacter phage HTVC041P]|uniref:Tail fiber protein n=1 Tax=Pelagibacter phage HTVC041P TaxID=3072833 RepID=A0AAX4G2S0_9CAUD|nr:tail fiber protein [Pelagibacter phage HTVC041P]
MSFLAQVTYTGDGSTTQYSITFPFIDSTHIKAFINGTQTTAFTISSSTLTFNSAPANSSTIRIERQTPNNTRLVDFTDGSVLTESDLDKSADQNFYIAQEITDDSASKIGIGTDDKIDAQSKIIKNVADPVNAQDAVSKNYLENTWLSTANKTALTTVNANIANINAVNSNATNINSAVSNATNINTVATNIGSVNTVATDIAKVIAVANDLAETVSEVETVANDLNETTSEIDTVANAITNVDAVGTNIANVNSVASNATNINAVAGNSTNINAVNSNSSNINTVAGQNSNITTLAGISANITTVAGISSNITTVAGMNSAISTVNSNSSNINTVAGAITNIDNVGNNIANVNTVATNLSGVNSFAERYRVQAGVPSSSNDVGDLVFDTTANKLKVFDGSSYALAGSSVNGTSQRFKFVATANQTTFSGQDVNSQTLTYDVASGTAFADIYLNGVKLDVSDFTASNGTSIILGSGASVGDILTVVSFGTFSLQNQNASHITTGTLSIDRLPSPTLTVKGDGSSTDGAIQLNCSQNSHGVKIKSPAHSAGQSYTLILPTSVGTNGQVLATNGNSTNQLSWVDAQETKPTVANVSQTIAPATATTINITGTNFVSIPQVDFVNGSTGAVTRANTVSFTNATTLSVNCTLASGNYYVRIENPDGNAGRSTNNIITASTAPSFSTSAGSLGTIAGNFSGTVATIAGTSDSAVTFSETTSVLTTANCTLSSAGVISTTDFGGSSTTPTTYNFTIRITDAEGQTADRAFSLTSSFGATGGAQFN